VIGIDLPILLDRASDALHLERLCPIHVGDRDGDHLETEEHVASFGDVASSRGCRRYSRPPGSDAARA
jgi:hypothetical protein